MKTNLSRYITGLLVLAAGVLLLLGNFDILNVKDLLRDWWPLAVIVAGLVIFINDVKNYLWALLVVGLGVVLELNALAITDVNPWQLLWPVVIVVIGLSILLNRRSFRRTTVAAAQSDMVAILGGSDHRSTSDNFTGSKVTTIMGGAKLDLRKATIKNEAVIDITGILGGVEVILPRNVVVKNEVNCILGGVEDKTEQETEQHASTVIIAGQLIMAGIELKN